MFRLLLEGFFAGDLWVHSAAPGHGSTTFLLNLCQYWKSKGNRVVYLPTEEIPPQEKELTILGKKAWPNSRDIRVPRGTDILAIDNLHNIPAPLTYRSSTETTNHVVRNLKRLALTGLPRTLRIFATTHVTRNAYSRAKNTHGYNSVGPFLHKSTEIERSADLITTGFLQKAPWDTPETGPGLLKIQFHKVRNGETPKPGFLEINPQTRTVYL